MKIVHLIFCFFLTSFIHAQKFIIPYRIGDKFGLSDEKGKILVQPAYDNIESLKYNYFQYTNHLVPKDTLITFTPPGQATRVYKKTGLFYKAKLILKNQLFSDYIVYPQLILGSSNPYHAENCMLFNTKGVPLLPEKVKAIYVNDERDIGYLGEASDANSLISIIERNNTGKRVMTLAVYNHQQQKITQYLFQKVMDYKLKKRMMGSSHVFCSYTDEKGLQEKLILYRNGKFELLDPTAIPQKDLEAYKTSRYEDDPVKIVEMPGGGFDGNVAVPPPEPTKPTNVDYVYYIVTKDSLFYNQSIHSNNIRKYIPVPENTKLLWKNPQSLYQWWQLLYQKENRYGFLQDGIFKEALYDSLFYVDNYNFFLAAKKSNGVLQYGILDEKGKELVPFEYDSITGNLLETHFDYGTYNQKSYMKIVFEEKRSYEVPTVKNPYVKKAGTYLQVFKNGKTGLLSTAGSIDLPVEYEQILANGFGFQKPRENEFLIVKQNGLYGVQAVRYNFQTRKRELLQLLKPVLPYIPGFYENNYYGISELKVYGWYDLNAKFIGYTNANGFAYFERELK